MKNIIYITGILFLSVSCESSTFEGISDNTPITSIVRYEADVKPIIENNCLNCHSSTSFAPLSNYNQVKANIDNIIDRIQRPAGDPLRMPQGGSLPQNQINIVAKWKADGLIEK